MSHHTNTEHEVFWQTGFFSKFKGKGDLDIHYAHFKQHSNAPVIVISPGRCESYLKYQETAYELFQSGYSLFLIDHRGQGLSSRMLTNQHKGYVENFDDYAEDLYQFITKIVAPKDDDVRPSVLAHSMGCAITLRMIQRYPNIIQKAVLLSPMIAISRGPLPRFLATGIVSFLEKLNQGFSKQPWYFAGQGNYKVKAFKNNPLTHNENRYNRFVDLYKNNKVIQLGGVTIKWLYEAFKTEKAIFSNLNKITTPILLIQGGKDIVVDNKKHNEFCQKLHHLSPQLIAPKPIVIEGAYHELLFEEDALRQQTIEETLNFIGT